MPAEDGIYNQAKKTYPNVNWGPQDFANHLNGEVPKFPADLFLGGAAGCREETAWNEIHITIAPRVRKILNNQPRADYSTDELWAELVGTLTDNDGKRRPLANGSIPAKIINYRGKIPLLNYMVIVGKRIAIQRNRNLKRTTLISLDRDPNDAMGIADSRTPSPDADAEEREMAGRLLKTMQAAYSQLNTEQKFLLEMVFSQDMMRKDAGQLLGWSESKTSRSISDALDKLQKAMKTLSDTRWGPILKESWSDFMKQNWKKPQEPQ